MKNIFMIGMIFLCGCSPVIYERTETPTKSPSPALITTTMPTSLSSENTLTPTVVAKIDILSLLPPGEYIVTFQDIGEPVLFQPLIYSAAGEKVLSLPTMRIGAYSGARRPLIPEDVDH